MVRGRFNANKDAAGSPWPNLFVPGKSTNFSPCLTNFVQSHCLTWLQYVGVYPIVSKGSQWVPCWQISRLHGPVQNASGFSCCMGILTVPCENSHCMDPCTLHHRSALCMGTLSLLCESSHCMCIFGVHHKYSHYMKSSPRPTTQSVEHGHHRPATRSLATTGRWLQNTLLYAGKF